MKHLVGLPLGTLLAVAIGCAGAPSKSAAPQATASNVQAGAPSPTETRTEIDALDAKITADMAALGIARPIAAPITCVGEDCAQQIAGVATSTVAPAPPTCKPAQTQTCTDVCKLKDSICTNAGRICQLAADLHGADAHANDRCVQGNASCDAARERCCGCM